MIDRSTGKKKEHSTNLIITSFWRILIKSRVIQRKRLSYNENGKISLKTPTLFNLKPQRRLFSRENVWKV